MTTAYTRNEITVDEVVALLKKTSLPTLIVEGSDDMIVYRRFEDDLAHIGVSVFPVGGRVKVLEVFKRRHEIPLSVKALFIADQDTWINSGIPPEYQNPKLLFTDGYSIENDVYRDGELWKLLQIPDRTRYEAEVCLFVEWYALALARHLVNPSCPIALHHDHVLNPMQKSSLLALELGESYPNALREEIFDDYDRLLRGKSLFSLFIKHTNAKGRGVRHTNSGLFDLVAIKPGPLLMNLLKKVEQGLTLV